MLLKYAAGYVPKFSDAFWKRWLEGKPSGWREGSAMVAVVHDETTDRIDPLPANRSYGRSEWYQIRDLLEQAWGGRDDKYTGDVKGYWKDFFMNLEDQDIFEKLLQLNSKHFYKLIVASFNN